MPEVENAISQGIADGRYLKLAGGTMTGDINMGGQDMTNMASLALAEQSPVPASASANTLVLYSEAIKGFSFLSSLDDTGMRRKFQRDSVFVGKNTTGSSIPAFRAVYAIGSEDDVPLIAKARANSVSTMPAIGVTLEAVANGAYGRIMQIGLVENANTSAFTAGDILYVSSTTAGILVATAPLWPNIRQEIGTILAVSATVGSVQVVARSMFNEGILDHGGLLGLADNDHTQYLLLAGGTMTGPIAMGGQNISGGGTITGQYLVATGGIAYIGVDDTTKGALSLYGDGTGADSGGVLYVHTAADHDGAGIDYYTVAVDQDDFKISQHTTLKLTLQGSDGTWLFGAAVNMGTNAITNAGDITGTNIYVGDDGTMGISGDVLWTFDSTPATSQIEMTTGCLMMGGAQRIYFEASGTTQGGEYISSDAADYLDIHFTDDDKGCRFYSGANLLLTVQRFDAANPTLTKLIAPLRHEFLVGATRIFSIQATFMIAHQELRMAADNRVIAWGTSADATAYYDGTHFVINPNSVGSGKVYIGATADDDIVANSFQTTTAGTEYVQSDDAGYMDYAAATAHRFDSTVFVVDSANGRIGVGIATPDNRLHIHNTTSGGAWAKWTNSTTGTGAGQGFLVGLDASEITYVRNYENTDMQFHTNNLLRFTIEAGGNLLVTDTKRLQFNAATEYINSAGAGYMDYAAATAHRFNTSLLYLDVTNTRVGVANAAPRSGYTFDVGGNVVISQAADIGSIYRGFQFVPAAYNAQSVFRSYGAVDDQFAIAAQSTAGTGEISVVRLGNATNGLIKFLVRASGGALAEVARITPSVMLVAGTNQIQFNDSGTYWNSPSNGVLAGVTDGTITLGAAATNQTVFSSVGRQTMIGTARVYQTDWLPASAIKAPAANQATYVDHGIAGAWQFADGSTKYIHVRMKMPNNWASGTDISFLFGWSSTTTDPGDDSKQAVWQIEVLPRGADEDTTAAAEATYSDAFSASGTAEGLVTSTLTIANAILSATDTCIIIRIARLGGDGDDDLGDTAEFLGCCLQYVADSLGEAT